MKPDVLIRLYRRKSCDLLARIRLQFTASVLQFPTNWSNTSAPYWCLGKNHRNKTVPLNTVCTYVPTLPSPDEDKDAFYDCLPIAFKSTPTTEHAYVLGDVNARVGNGRYYSWPDFFVKYGVGKLLQMENEC